MNTKTLIAALAAGAVIFFLGWGIYGLLLESFLKENSNRCMNREPEEMIMWGMILSNLCMGYMLATILSWANVNNFMSGLTKGALFGLLLSIGMDLQFYSVTTFFKTSTALIVDVAVWIVMMGIAGGVIGYLLGRGNKSEPA